MKKRFTSIFLILILIVSLSAPLCVSADDYDTYKIYYEGKRTGYEGYYVKGNAYLPLDIIEFYCDNSGITVNKTAMQLEIDLSTQNIMMADDETSEFIKANAGIVHVPLKKINGDIVFSINVMEQFYKLSYAVNEDENTIKLRPYSGTEKIARIKNANVTAIPSLDNDDSDLVTLSQNQRVYITGETSNYYLTEDFDGSKYYVFKDHIVIEDIDLSSVDFYAPKKEKFVQKENEKINIAWQYVNTSTPDAPEKTAGIDIMAPVWFRLIVEGGGNVTNGGDKGFTELCHQNGFRVWATITNNMSETGSTNFTTKMFSTPEIMDKAIAQYIFYSCLYDVDGINIDFEDVKDADAAGLVEFTKNMRYYTEKQGLNLSIDTLIPKPWTIEYDRDALAEYVDYLAIMTYDEHYSGSSEPGSIASLPWVEEAVVETIKEGVPKEKILMGMPMYTRVWVVDSSNKIQSAGAATMANIQNLLNSNNATIKYLAHEKQNYAEYASGTNTAKIWIEDEVSVSNRLSLINTYDLAGSACWQYSQATEEIWELFDLYLH